MFYRKLIGTAGVSAIAITMAPVVAQAQGNLPQPQASAAAKAVAPKPLAQMKATLNRKAGRLDVKITADAANKLTTEKIVATTPKGVNFSTKGFKPCSAKTINGTPGISDAKCPKGSQVGTGSATAVIPPNPKYGSPAMSIAFKMKIYAAGPKALTFFLSATTPGLESVRVAFPSAIQQKGGRSSLVTVIPENLRMPMPGFYTYLTSIDTRLGANGPKGARFIKIANPKRKRQLQFDGHVHWASNPAKPPAPTKLKTVARW